MKKIHLLASLAVGLYLLAPNELMATTQTSVEFGGNVVSEYADKINNFLFGPVSKLVSTIGFAMGSFYCIIQGAFQRLFSLLGIGITVVVIPKFISSIFTVLLP